MSNLRVVLPSGSIISVGQMKPVVEKIITFNGDRRRFLEDAKDMKKEANGLRIFRAAESSLLPVFGNNEVIIGNLKNEQVCEIISQLCEKGFYDFSQFEYQKVNSLADLKLGEEYPPYNSEDNIMLGAVPNFPSAGIGGCGSIFDNAQVCDETDYECDDESEGEDEDC